MKLDRHNYEEYFILYLDNELDSESRREVENFAQANPDLKAELDMLLQSKLNPDPDIVFDNKESLLVRNSSLVNMANYEDWLISYIDNELTEEERKDVKNFVIAHPAIQKELDLFQKVKLQPEAIVFPNKELLYRKEEKARVIPVRWWRIAAAAVLLLGISTTAILLLNNKTNKVQPGGGVAGLNPQHKDPAVVTGISQQKNSSVNKDSITNVALQENKSPVKAGKHPVSVKDENNIALDKNKRRLNTIVTDRKEIIKDKQVDDQANNNDLVIGTPKHQANDLSRPINQKRFVAKQTDPNSTAALTPKDNPVLTNNKVTEQDVQPSYAVEQSSGNKGIRGFLRKVTRTIEKRTNMKPTDDDDRLLIAGLAIKLN
jgi:hypothetical protein